MIAALSGLVAGLAHVLAGPDHLSAVAPLALDDRERGWLTGLRWGLGHASGVLGVGLLALLFRSSVQVEVVSSWAERLVGVVLVGIGLWGLRRAWNAHVHTHEHTHDGQRHVHIHVHGHATAHRHPSAKGHQHTHAAFVVGALHGMAGGSHLLGILPVLAFQSRVESAVYLGAYGVGTILAMASFAWVFGTMAQRAAFNGPKAYQFLMGSCSCLAVGLGGYWLLG